MRIYLIACLIICLSCKTKKISDEKLCKDFIYLNKNKKFKVLFEISTINSRTSSVFQAKTNQNKIIFNDLALFCDNDSVIGKFITIPLKTNQFVNKQSAFYKKELFFSCKNNGVVDLNFYKQYVLDFETEINSVTTPAYHNNSNVMIDSHPNLGHFIEFILNEKSKVYYLEDENSLNDNWKIQFKKFKNIDKNWYYSSL